MYIGVESIFFCQIFKMYSLSLLFSMKICISLKCPLNKCCRNPGFRIQWEMNRFHS